MNLNCYFTVIQQWSVFALRNLCENNRENQAAISNMKLEGVADRKGLLREFGIEAHIEGDKIAARTTKKEGRSPYKSSKR